ncbi:MAG: hypothetical protein RL011_1381, partial [Pseudomonadota bacterium]
MFISGPANGPQLCDGLRLMSGGVCADEFDGNPHQRGHLGKQNWNGL